MEGFEVAPYFERRVLDNPQRAHLVPYISETVRNPDETFIQSDGKVRHWRYVPELRYHNSNYTRKKGRPE